MIIQIISIQFNSMIIFVQKGNDGLNVCQLYETPRQKS